MKRGLITLAAALLMSSNLSAGAQDANPRPGAAPQQMNSGPLAC